MIFKPKRLAGRLFGGSARVTTQALWRLNVVLAAVYAAQALAILLFGVAYHRPLNVYFLTNDSLQANVMHHPVSALAIRQILAINLAWLVAAWLVVMAAIHLALATLNRTAFEEQTKRGAMPLRWLAVSTPWALMLITLSMLVGIYDLGTLLLIMMLAATMGFLGYGMEARAILSKRQQAQNPVYSWLVLAASLAPLLIIAVYIAATHIFGNGGVLSMYIYPMLATVLVLIAAFGCNRYLLRAKRAAWRNNEYGEFWYMLLSLALTTAVAWQVFAAVLRP